MAGSREVPAYEVGHAGPPRLSNPDAKTETGLNRANSGWLPAVGHAWGLARFRDEAALDTTPEDAVATGLTCGTRKDKTPKGGKC